MANGARTEAELKAYDDGFKAAKRFNSKCVACGEWSILAEELTKERDELKEEVKELKIGIQMNEVDDG